MASIEPYKTTKLNDLKINLVDTKATFYAMQQAEIVESNQLYFIEEKDVGSTVEYIVGTQTASTGSWTGVTKDSELTVGKVIAYKLPYAGSGNASLTLTFTNPTGNNTSGAIPVFLNNTQVTTHYAAKSVILMVYDGTNWRSTDYWNSNSRDAGYGKISITQSDAVTAIEPNTNQLEATTYNEKMTVTAGNKWIKLAGTNGASNADVLTIGHSVSGVTAGDYGDSTNQTPTYGKTFQVPYISVDAGGHITSISTHTVKIPASDNTNTATAADNILDGSNSGTQITYAPYDTQQNKLSFDTSDTAPTRTDRLNLNGYLYATKLYSGGNEVLTAHQTLPTATTSQKGLVQIGSGITVNDGTISVTAANLGLSNAMHFIGVATVAITDGSTDDPVISGYSTKTAGDVIIDKDSSYEYVWSSANKWERLGGDSSYKTKQTVVNSPSANGSTTAFIDTISQNANGVITVTKKNLDTSGTWSGNAGSATKLKTARSLTTKLNSTTAVIFDGSADQNAIPVTGILPIANGGTGTDTLTSGEALIGNGTSAITTRTITNNTTATVAAKTNNLITNNTLYYATASINNARQTNNVSIYAPTTAGTANQILVSKGGTSAPDWKATANGAAYATSTNGALTFGTLPIAQGGTGQTTWTADGLLYASAATTLASKVPAWEDWTAGTTAGPKAKIQLGNKNYESAAIPSASVSASGVVTTGAQDFKGRKGFNLISRYGKKDDGTTAVRWTGDTILYNGATTPVMVGEYWYDYGDATNITKGQYFWRQYSPNSTSNTTTTTKYETYSLPNVTSGLSANKDYSILTSKETITVEQGGTGVTSIANIQAGKDGDGNTISSTYLKLSGGTMSGGVTFVGNQTSAWNDKGILFTNGSRIGENVNKALGLYSGGTFYIRPDCATSVNSKGLEISSTEMIPSTTNDMSLGNINHVFTNVFSNAFSVTSVSYGDASNRPTNPNIGQLYFQFID